MSLALRKVFAVAAAAALGAALFAFVSPQADAHHEPANKFAAAGSDVDTLGGDGEQIVLSEQMKVSTPFDLLLQLTSECAIVTELTTNETNPAADAYGSVRMRIEIDDKPVPVASDDVLADPDADPPVEAPGEDDATDDDDQIGEVTFCNRAYGREVTDQEDGQDGQDQESDYIHSRTANAFNWIATDVGRQYDSPANGNNIIKIEVYADYDADFSESAFADAFVGSRTLVAEPTNLSVHEAVEPEGGAGS